jgi:hypothetical protein
MVWWLLLACAEPAAESADVCDEPLYTWDNWGAGFFGSYCLSCHSAGTPDRRGAPPGVDFDSESQVRSFAAAITRSIDDGTMPIGGGLPEADRERLQAWLACGEGGAAYSAPAVVAEYTPEEAEAAAKVVLELVPTLSFGLHDWLVGAVEDLGTGDGCPQPLLGEEEGDWTLYWDGDCAGERVTLHGDIIVYYDWTAREGASLIQLWDLFSLTGTTVRNREDLFAGGNTSIVWEVKEDAASIKMLWGGAYGDPSSDGPLATPFSGGVTVEGTFRPEGGFNGELAGAMSTDGAALDVRSLIVDQGQLTGELAIRDPSSGWWVVELAEDGSGCGPLTFGGESFGESCLAQDVLFDLNGELAAQFEASQ